MSVAYYDRVREDTETAGTGALLLLGSPAGFRPFSIVGDGYVCHYCIESDQGDWEVGQGTYFASGPSLSRDLVLASSNGNSLVDLPPGTKRVFMPEPAGAIATAGVGPPPTPGAKGSIYLDVSDPNNPLLYFQA